MERIPGVAPELLARAVAEESAAECGVDLERLLSASRNHRVTLARHSAFYLADRLTTLSFRGIGELLGRDRATVMYGIERMHRRASVDAECAASLRRIESAVRDRFTLPQM